MAENLEKALPKKNNLYKLTFNGYSMKTCYVIAPDPTSAERKVLEPMKADRYGYYSDAIVKRIELIAQDNLYTNVEAVLFA